MTTQQKAQRRTPSEPADQGAEWRWRNYTERLTDLYDLDGGAGGPLSARPRPTQPDTAESARSRR